MKITLTVIIPVYNAASTIMKTLDSLYKQTYPFDDVIIMNDHSTDNSVAVINEFIKQKKKKNIQIITNTGNRGMGAVYNKGVKLATSEYIIFLHSDSILGTPYELARLVAPIEKDASIVMTYSSVLMPEEIWRNYPFWEKYLLARSVGESISGFNGKFDCVKKSVFMSIGGFDDKRFGHELGVGGEDADLHMRLTQVGKVCATQAKVIHLHYLNNDYSLKNLMENRKLLARSYGRLMRVQGVRSWIFFIKPFLVFATPLVYLYPWIILLYLSFAIIYMKQMYVGPFDWRIIVLPLFTLYMVYYESYWMAHSYFKK